MKINNIKNVSNYGKKVYKKNDKKIESGKFDSILISRSNKKCNEALVEISDIKSRVMNNISSDMSTEKFTAIKNEIKNGTYEINAKELADLLLK